MNFQLIVCESLDATEEPKKPLRAVGVAGAAFYKNHLKNNNLNAGNSGPSLSDHISSIGNKVSSWWNKVTS